MNSNELIQLHIKQGILQRVEHANGYSAKRDWSEYARIYRPLACFHNDEPVSVLLSLNHLDRIIDRQSKAGVLDPAAFSHKGGDILDFPARVEPGTLYSVSNDYLSMMVPAFIGMCPDTYAKMVDGLDYQELRPLKTFQLAQQRQLQR